MDLRAGCTAARAARSIGNLARAARRYGRIILAGGLTPENIAEAIRVAEPYAVDVASGVEARPGRKDPARLRALFAAVESARRRFCRGIL